MNLISFTGEIVAGLTAAAYRSSVSVIIHDLNILRTGLDRNATTEQLRPRIEDALEKLDLKPACIVYISQYPRNLPDLLAGLPCPSIAIYCWGTGAQTTINFDDQQGAHDAVSYLIQHGRKNIVMLCGPVDNHATSERIIGYQRALVEHGMPFHPKLVWVGDWEVASGYSLTKKLLTSSTPPDAIFSQNDSMAVGAMQAIHEAGLQIPKDIAVVGFDHTPFVTWTTPTLTSVAPPFTEMGEAALKSFESLLEGDQPHEIVINLPCKVMVRDSVE